MCHLLTSQSSGWTGCADCTCYLIVRRARSEGIRGLSGAAWTMQGAGHPKLVAITMDRRMLRWSPPPYPYVWSSGLVLMALSAVLADIHHVRQQRLNAAPTGVETILHSQQLTYVAEPVAEPRELPIELIDPGLPLSLQESYAALRSDYHPARAGQHAARPLPTPIPLDDVQDADSESNGQRGAAGRQPADRGQKVTSEARDPMKSTRDPADNRQKEQKEFTPEKAAPTLAAPDRSGSEPSRPANSSTQTEARTRGEAGSGQTGSGQTGRRDVSRDEDEGEEAERDSLHDVLQRLPPTYPHSPRRFPEIGRSAEIQSSFIADISEISEVSTSEEQRPRPLARVEERPRRDAGRPPAIPLFSAPEPAPVAKGKSNSPQSPYWSATRWSRATEVDRGIVDDSLFNR